MTVDEVRARLLVGAPVPRAPLSPRVRRALSVAESVGAPAVPALDAAVDAEDASRRARRAVSVATAQARVVATGLVALPALAVLGIGALLGDQLWRFYLTLPGRVVAAFGVGMVSVGLLVMRGMVRRVLRGVGAVDDEVVELIAVAVTGGVAPSAALGEVARVLPTWATDLRRAALATGFGTATTVPPPVDRVLAQLDVGTRWGVPAAPALRRLAADLRAEELTSVLVAAERLPALLTVPTALLLLPATLLLVGAPLLAAGLAAGAGATP